jgi:XTP/dITP diphosphohydrolase
MEHHAPLDLLIATRNPGKILEIREMLSGLEIKLRTLDEFPDIIPVDEVGVTYIDNASLKAVGYARQTGTCALADDSGLEVEALSGKPGVFSARFGGPNLSDSERTEKLLLAISDSGFQRSARFVCAMAFAGWLTEEPQGSEPQLLHLTEGTCDGHIATQAHGSQGFGFDPVFIPHGYSQTFAELPSEVKSHISHRAVALAKMRLFLGDLPLKLDRAVRRP